MLNWLENNATSPAANDGYRENHHSIFIVLCVLQLLKVQQLGMSVKRLPRSQVAWHNIRSFDPLNNNPQSPLPWVGLYGSNIQIHPLQSSFLLPGYRIPSPVSANKQKCPLLFARVQ